MAPLAARINVARRVAHHPRIRVTDIEARLGTRYTLDTIEALKRRHPTARFVWLMGADNLAQISRWRGWTGIFHSVPVAVFTRPTYSLRALSRSEEHTSELQSLMRISYAVFCLKQKNSNHNQN